MAISRHGPTLRHVGALFQAGTVADLSDRQLLERYATGGGEASELAFTALLERHGAMVFRVCRDVLGDEHAAQDAFQATFVVLARRSTALRPRESLGPWLHEVACRVALSARSAAYRRRRHERRAAELQTRPAAAEPELGDDDRLAIHEEVDRLPDRYRAAVVLCCLQGLTHEQAARRLGCPLGTVQSRVARGRDRLRGRLVRRGLAPGAVVLGLADSSRSAPAMPSALAEATLRGIAQLTAASSATMAGAFPASAVALADGVFRTMMLTKLKVAAAALLSAVILVAGTGILAGQIGGQRAPGAAAAGPAPGQVGRADGSNVSDEEWRKMSELRLARMRQTLKNRLVEAARQRLEAQREFYKQGRITIDRYLDASNQLWHAEIQASPSRDGRIAAARARLDRAKEIEANERKELEAGRGTMADVAEATQAREQAELDLIEGEKSDNRPEIEILRDRVTALEGRLDRALEALEEIKRRRD